jgi:hypothetical protein
VDKMSLKVINGGCYMTYYYFCSHCKSKIGELDKDINSNLLGFNNLTREEKDEMINYLPNGDIIVNSICKNCEEYVTRYALNFDYDTFIQ